MTLQAESINTNLCGSQMSEPESGLPLQCAAYYLGQYHRIELNDRYWGTGFTEWHNVAKARPLYPGHSQPKLPGKLGFYDLRCTDTLQEQIAYSQEIGVSAFCHWHYWFGGRRLLHQPLDAMIHLQYPNFKFMLAWANESWSGVWHGASDKILIGQSYNAGELEDHAKLIARYIETGQYLTVDGKYPFVIYRPRQIPDSLRYLSQLRNLVHRFSGGELYIIGNWFQGGSHGFKNPSDLGLDAAVVTPIAPSFSSPRLRKTYAAVWGGLRRIRIGPEIRPYGQVSSALEKAIREIQGTSHATIVSGWDNTPRSGRRGLVLAGYNEQSLRQASAHALGLEKRNKTRLLFLKSWNEWAEGNTVEPQYKEEWSAGSVIREVLRGKQNIDELSFQLSQSVRKPSVGL